MSIYTKQIEDIEYVDLQELVTEKASENTRLEFKQEVPARDDLMKTVSSFTNTYGGHLVIGVKQDKDARAKSLVGVATRPGFHQQLTQWCYDRLYPPVNPRVSREIVDPTDSTRVLYVILVDQSEDAPHFINGRRGCYIRTDEYSQHFEPRLATYEEISHLAERRAAAVRLREHTLALARARFDTHTRKLQSEKQCSRRRRPYRMDCSRARLPPTHLLPHDRPWRYGPHGSTGFRRYSLSERRPIGSAGWLILSRPPAEQLRLPRGRRARLDLLRGGDRPD
jgi:hypothetical protein